MCLKLRHNQNRRQSILDKFKEKLQDKTKITIKESQNYN